MLRAGCYLIREQHSVSIERYSRNGLFILLFVSNVSFPVCWTGPHVN